MPPEWAPQEALWLSWPVVDPRHWDGNKAEIMEAKFAEIAANVTRFEPVRINVEAKDQSKVLELCNRAKAAMDRVELFDHAHNDVWCRDHGPIFVKHSETGEVALTDWEFNAWGEKFEPWDLDNSIPKLIADSLGIKRIESGMVLEGGAIEVNGDGKLLTTEAVLLNPNRNPQFSKGEIEQKLRDHLGASDILWLKQGIEGDDTDGHIDDLARFIDANTILAATDTGINQAILYDNLQRLRSYDFEVLELPLPEVCEVPGWRLPVLPASYVNFVILNDGVLVPTFRQAKNDDHALGMIRELFPSREVKGIDCLDLVEEGGSLHCISMQQPA